LKNAPSCYIATSVIYDLCCYMATDERACKQLCFPAKKEDKQ
jgi:hypothetical protein